VILVFIFLLCVSSGTKKSFGIVVPDEWRDFVLEPEEHKEKIQQLSKYDSVSASNIQQKFT